MTATVFNSLVGQEGVISTLQKAIDSAKTDNSTQDMTHAWLFTGPPGSGRCNAARSFAAALVCESGGCATCINCNTALSGSHQDVEVIDVTRISIKIDEIREIVARSAWRTSTSRWRVIVIEDCERLTEAAANSLLKALEEPGASTIWLLCAPTLHEVPPTIRSRCRNINLKTPRRSEITRFLLDELEADETKAEFIAQLSQGHVSKARALLSDERLQVARKKSFEILFSTKSEASAIRAAKQLLELAQDEVESRLSESLEKEVEALKSFLQGTGRSTVSGGAKSIKNLEKDHKERTNRAIKDEIDCYMLDYITLFRDCQSPNSPSVNTDLGSQIGLLTENADEDALASLIAKARVVRERLLTSTSQTLLLESFFLAFSTQNRGT